MTAPALTSRHSMIRDLLEHNWRHLSRPPAAWTPAEPIGPAFRALDAELSLRWEAAAAEAGIDPEPAEEPIFAEQHLPALPPRAEAAIRRLNTARDDESRHRHRQPRRLWRASA